MSFWGKLGKILSVAAPIVAAPLTGGTSLLGLAGAGAGTAAAIGTGIGAAGSLLSSAGTATGKAADSLAGNRGEAITADMQQQDRRQAQTNSYWSQMANLNNQEMDRGTTNAALRGTNLKQLQQAEYLKGAEGYTPRDGGKSYGFGPKASTEAERQAAGALSDQLVPTFGSDIVAPFERPDMPTPYTMSAQLPKGAGPSVWEKILNVASPVMTVAGQYARQQPTTPTRPNADGMDDVYGQYGVTR